MEKKNSITLTFVMLECFRNNVPDTNIYIFIEKQSFTNLMSLTIDFFQIPRYFLPCLVKRLLLYENNHHRISLNALKQYWNLFIRKKSLQERCW